MPLIKCQRHLQILALAVLSAFHAQAATVSLWVERAPTPNGPWVRVPLGDTNVDADGNPRLPLDSTNEFYRTQVKLSGEVTPGDRISLAAVPSLVRSNALRIVQKHGKMPSDPEGWPEGVELAPEVLPVHAVGRDGLRPTVFEFKLLKPARSPLRVGPLATHPEDHVQRDAGYLLLGATTDDFPVLEFATEGPTLSETLARVAKTSRFNLVRYGPGLVVAEDERGGIMASLGSMPFKLDTNVFLLDGVEWQGDDTNGVDITPRVPVLRATGYADYAAFKKDFLENDVYERLRQIKRARAKFEWDILNGNPPPGVTVAQRRSIRVLTDVPLTPVPEVLLVGEESSFARVSVSSTGGIIITGVSPGQGLLRVRPPGQPERNLVIKVTPAVTQMSTPELIESASFYAGDWSMQLKYHQFEDSDWCPVVGCGPVAWAMLFGWFDRYWGAEYAFNGEGSGSAPPMHSASSANRAKVRPAYRELHEQCDVICLAGSGATYPTDMTEGFKGYTYFYAASDMIRRQWRINAITGTWPEAGALRCRDAIKDGYPSVVGLGYLWHYALAYGYAYEIYDIGAGYTATVRYLKCNMGWGPDVAPRWYNLGDTFYAADVKIWKGPKG